MSFALSGVYVGYQYLRLMLVEVPIGFGDLLLAICGVEAGLYPR